MKSFCLKPHDTLYQKWNLLKEEIFLLFFCYGVFSLLSHINVFFFQFLFFCCHLITFPDDDCSPNIWPLHPPEHSWITRPEKRIFWWKLSKNFSFFNVEKFSVIQTPSHREDHGIPIAPFAHTLKRVCERVSKGGVLNGVQANAMTESDSAKKVDNVGWIFLMFHSFAEIMHDLKYIEKKSIFKDLLEKSHFLMNNGSKWIVIYEMIIIHWKKVF